MWGLIVDSNQLNQVRRNVIIAEHVKFDHSVVYLDGLLPIKSIATSSQDTTSIFYSVTGHSICLTVFVFCNAHTWTCQCYLSLGW
jgi:hypothetical protein